MENEGKSTENTQGDEQNDILKDALANLEDIFGESHSSESTKKVETKSIEEPNKGDVVKPETKDDNKINNEAKPELSLFVKDNELNVESLSDFLVKSDSSKFYNEYRSNNKQEQQSPAGKNEEAVDPYKDRIEDSLSVAKYMYDAIKQGNDPQKVLEHVKNEINNSYESLRASDAEKKEKEQIKKEIEELKRSKDEPYRAQEKARVLEHNINDIVNTSGWGTADNFWSTLYSPELAGNKIATLFELVNPDKANIPDGNKYVQELHNWVISNGHDKRFLTLLSDIASAEQIRKVAPMMIKKAQAEATKQADNKAKSKTLNKIEGSDKQEGKEKSHLQHINDIFGE